MKGFTLIEALVSVTIMALLTSILIVYSRSGESQIVIFKDQAKIIGALLKAKNLALQTYILGEESVCGYGVRFDAINNEAILFKDLSDPCSASDNRYSGSSENFEKFPLDQNLRFSKLDFTNILFVPPAPDVIIDGDANKKGNFEIVIESQGGSAQKKIKVNDFGQVTAQ